MGNDPYKAAFWWLLSFVLVTVLATGVLFAGVAFFGGGERLEVERVTSPGGKIGHTRKRATIATTAQTGKGSFGFEVAGRGVVRKITILYLVGTRRRRREREVWITGTKRCFGAYWGCGRTGSVSCNGSKVPWLLARGQNAAEVRC